MMMMGGSSPDSKSVTPSRLLNTGGSSRLNGESSPVVPSPSTS